MRTKKTKNPSGNKFTPAKAALTKPVLAQGTVNPQILQARKELHKISSELPTRIAKEAIVHCAAPTGTGKTIACMHYGARIASEGEFEHLIFATPYILLTDQAEGVIKTQLLETSLKVAKTHSKMVYESEAERKKARGLGFDVTICTTQKLHLALLGYKKHQIAQYNLRKSVIIIDDASQYLKPKIAAAVLVVLDNLRKQGARIILASGSLPHYEKIDDYLPKEVKIHRFGEKIQTMPGIKTRCRIEAHSRPVGIDHLTKIVKKQKKPFLIICETIEKSICVFNELKKAMPKTKLFLVNARQSKAHKKRDIAIIEDALRTKSASNMIIVSTSITNSGWDVSFASGVNDTFDTILALEHAGRINRAMEFEQGVLHCMQIQIPGIRRNTTVDTTRRIAMELMENNQFTDTKTATLAATLELEEKNDALRKEAKKAVVAAKKGNFKYLRTHIQTMEHKTKGVRTCLPPMNELPELYQALANLFKSLDIRAQVFKGGKLVIKDKISHEQIQKLLEKGGELYEEYSIEISEQKLKEYQGKGDILRRIVYQLPNGKEEETEYYFLAPSVFNPETGLLN